MLVVSSAEYNISMQLDQFTGIITYQAASRGFHGAYQRGLTKPNPFGGLKHGDPGFFCKPSGLWNDLSIMFKNPQTKSAVLTIVYVIVVSYIST